MKFRLSIAVFAGSFTLSFAQTPHYPTIGQVVRMDARLDKLIPKNAAIEVLASGLSGPKGRSG